MGRTLLKLTFLIWAFACFTFKVNAQTPGVEFQINLTNVQLSGSMVNQWTKSSHSEGQQNMAAAVTNMRFGFHPTVGNAANFSVGLGTGAFKANQNVGQSKTIAGTYGTAIAARFRFTDTRNPKFHDIDWGTASGGTTSINANSRDAGSLSGSLTSSRPSNLSGGTTIANSNWTWQWRYTSAGPKPIISTSAPTTYCNSVGSGLTFTAPALSYRSTAYRWEYREGTTGNWSTALGASDGQNYTTPASLTTTTQFRRVDLYRDSYSGTVTYNVTSASDPITIRIDRSPSGNQPANKTVCAGEAYNVTIPSFDPGSGSVTVEWSTDPTFGDASQVIQSGTSHVLTATSPKGIPSQNISVRAIPSGTCGSAVIIGTFTVTFVQPSVAPDNVTASATTICEGSPVTLTMNGAVLGTGARYEWSTNANFTSIVHTHASDPTYTVSPSTSTTYYGRVGNTNSPCSPNTAYESVQINVNSKSVAPTGILASQPYFCEGSTTPITLQVDGGALGTGAEWEWYENGDLNNPAHVGASYSFIPTATTTYSVRAVRTASPCDAETDTASIEIAFRSASDISTATVTSSTNGVCEGSSVSLGISGGSLGYGAEWKWYAGSCNNGTYVGSGNSVTVTPATTTEYFVRAEGDCNTTVCKSVVIKVFEQSINPESISMAKSFCETSPTLQANLIGGKAGTGINWAWYYIDFDGDTTRMSQSGRNPTFNIADLWDNLGAETLMAIGEEDGSEPDGIPAPCLSETAPVFFDLTDMIMDFEPAIDELIAQTAYCGPNNTPIEVDGFIEGEDYDFNTVISPTSKYILYKGQPGNGGVAIDSNQTGLFNPYTEVTTTYYVEAITSCGKVTDNITITINNPSTDPTSLSADNPTVCSDNNSVTLTINGGELGTDAVWALYDEDPDANPSAIRKDATSGTTFSVTPSVTTDYFVRFEGTAAPCTEDGQTVTVKVTVNEPSTAPTNISADVSTTICNGANTQVTLTANGTLGTDAEYEWATDASFNNKITGENTASITVSPTSTTTYYARIVGTASPCNDVSGSSASTTITVNDPSTAPTDMTATVSTICNGSSTTLTANGGTLGTDAEYEWATDASFNNVISGETTASITVSPISTTTYYARIVKTASPCDDVSTTSVSTTITVNDPSTVPTEVTATISAICNGDNTQVTLTANGTLGTDAEYEWAIDASFTNVIAGETTASITVSPTTTTTYYARIVNTASPCTDVSGSSASTTITVTESSTAPTDITVSTSTICNGANTQVTLTANGTLGTDAEYEWATDASFNNKITGENTASISVSPISTTTYFVRIVGTASSCGDVSGSSASTTITVNDPSTAPTDITASTSTICNGAGTNVTLTADGTLGTDAEYEWATDASFTSVISGTTASISVSPTTTTTYYARIVGTASPCDDVDNISVSTTITVNEPSTDPTSLTADNSTVCASSNAVELTLNGGTLGTDAQWVLYNEDPVANPSAINIGTSSSATPTFNVSPSATTVYYVRYEGPAPCNELGTAVTTTVTVEDSSTDPTGLTASVSTVCSDNNSVTLTISNDGELGTGARWYLYDVDPASSGAVSIDDTDGYTFTVTPTEFTTYYVRYESTAQECSGVGSVVSTSVDVNEPSAAPTTITASTSTICNGDNTQVTLTADGTLGTDAEYEWATDASFTSVISGTTSSITVSPVSTTTYYARIVGTASPCNDVSGSSASTTITVDENSTNASGLTADLSIVCSNDNDVTLTVQGGTLKSGAKWKLYDEDPTSGTAIAMDETTGTTFEVNPSATTTYYVRFESTSAACNPIGDTVQVTVTVADPVVAPTSINISNDRPCYGEQVTLTQVGGVLTNATSYFEWATDMNFTNVIGTSTTNSINTTVTSLGSYYVRAVEPSCNTTTPVFASIDWMQGATTVFEDELTPNSVSVSICEVNDNAWHYFVDEDGRVLAAINSNGQDLGRVEWTVNLGNNGPYPNPNNVLCTDGEYYVDRHYSFETEHKAASDIGIRIFITPAEYASFKSITEAAIANYPVYKVCWGETEDPTDLQVSAFYEHDQGAIGEAFYPAVSVNGGPNNSHQYQFNIKPRYSQGGKGNVNIDNNTNLYLHNTGGRSAILPVELTSFTATVVEEGVLLNWSTASEQNNDRFDVLRSTDGKNFVKVGEVAGNGNSTTPQDYLFLDQDVTAGVYYYQLRQVDYDGASELSKIVSVEIEGAQASLEVGLFYPNPTQSISSVQVTSPRDAELVFSLYSIDGKLAVSKIYQVARGENRIDIDLVQVPAGSYVGVFQTQGKIVNRKLIVQE